MKDQRDYDPGPNAKPLGSFMLQTDKSPSKSEDSFAGLIGQPGTSKKPKGMQMGLKKLIGQ